MSLNDAPRKIIIAFAWMADLIRGRAGRYFESFAEVFIVVLFGLLPFIIAVIRHNMTNELTEGIDISTAFHQSFSGGQLYLYAFSLFGTLMWLSIFNWTIPRYKSRLFIALFVVLIGFIIVAMGGVDPTFSNIKNKTLISLSHYCYIMCIFLYLLLLMISKGIPPSVRNVVDGEADELIGKTRNELGNA